MHFVTTIFPQAYKNAEKSSKKSTAEATKDVLKCHRTPVNSFFQYTPRENMLKVEFGSLDSPFTVASRMIYKLL